MPKSRDPGRDDELLRDVILDPEPEDGDTEPNREPRRGARRLQRLPGNWVRVPIQWLTKPHKPYPYDAKGRLFTYLLHRSRWGQRTVVLTDELAAEIGISPSWKRKAARQLERDEWVRIAREGRQKAMVVTVLVHSG